MARGGSRWGGVAATPSAGWSFDTHLRASQCGGEFCIPRAKASARPGLPMGPRGVVKQKPIATTGAVPHGEGMPPTVASSVSGRDGGDVHPRRDALTHFGSLRRAAR